MIITINETHKARIQSVDLEAGVLTFQLLDDLGSPIGEPGQHGKIDLENLELPVTEMQLAAFIEDILPDNEEVSED